MPRILIFIFVFAFAASLECSAQKNIPEQRDTTQYWRVETNDENEFVGKIKSVGDGVMVLDTEKFGTITIRLTDIKLMEEADPTKVSADGYWADNFQSTRYFWMPNGFGLKPGEAYYQNVWIFFNQFGVGITKNLSVAAGIMPIFLLGADVVPVWISPKLSLPISKKVNLGTGVLYLTGLSLDNDFKLGGIGVVYANVTIGSRDKNASIGLGYGFSEGDFAKRPVITFATMTRLGQRSYLMTESYLFGVGGDSESVGLISVGGRRLIKRVGLDFGGFMPVVSGLDRVIIIPWLGFSVPLGKRHDAN